MDESGLPGSDIPQPDTGQVASEAPPAAPVPVEVPPSTKLPTSVPLVILGFITPGIITAAALVLAGVLDNNVLSPLVGLVLPVLVFVLVLVLFLRGKTTRNSNLMSYGKGGLFAYLTVPLLALIAFGTCLVQLNG